VSEDVEDQLPAPKLVHRAQQMADMHGHHDAADSDTREH
jgi:hypothetical protein